MDERISRGRAIGVLAAATAGLGTLGAAAARAAAPAQTVMMIRHGEKPYGAPPFGIDANGNLDKESLTPQGWQRAGALVQLFAPAVTPLRPGIFTPASLFAADPGASGSKRPLQTITPLAARLGLTIDSSVAPTNVTAIGAKLAAAAGVSLVAWQHTQLAGIAAALGTVNQPVPTDWPQHRFDVVWIFTRRSDGTWDFAQQTQQLLPGDKKHKVIA